MNQYGDYLLRTAYLLINDYQKAEETVQDTFMIAFNKMDQLEDVTKLKSWLTTIVINQCRSNIRKWSWKNVFPTYELFEKTNESDAVLNPEQVLMDKINTQKISEAILQLDYKYREVITLYYFNEMKIAEISLHTKTKQNTVKSRLKRGRYILKKLLEKGEVIVGERKNTSET